MYPFRQVELVGKRFLSVREKNSFRRNSRSSRVSNPLDYEWTTGVIRSCSEKDAHHPELKVLVEYDNEDWTTREWLRIHDGSFKIFLVEKTMVWSQRPDPSDPRRPLLWPALTFSTLIDNHGLSEREHPVPVEFVGDHERVFVRREECRSYGQDDDALQPVLRNNSDVMKELRQWQLQQKSKSILLDGPFTLTGFRVKVYRQTCRQWFSAVITGHDLMSRELSVMDDTVLQTHRVNPRLVQVILLANEPELDSVLRGELVRVLPMRQHRHSQVIITAPLTQTTSSTHHSVAPSSWQLYAGLTQTSNARGLENSNQAAYLSSVSSTCTRPNTSNSPSSEQVSTKARRKSADAKNRSAMSHRSTRSNSSSSPVPSKETHTPQTLQSSFAASSVSSPMVNQRTAAHGSGQLNCTLSPSKNSSLSIGSSTLPNEWSVKEPISSSESPNVLQYNSSPVSNPTVNRSPFRSTPFCASPDKIMSSVVSMASPISVMSHIGMQSPGHVVHSGTHSSHPLYSHPMGHLNLSPNQLYALQLQQQQQMQTTEQQDFLTNLWHQHYQNLLHQYQMHCYQLQLILQQQEIIQQKPLTLEQRNFLVEYYNQLLHQYQRAQNLQQLAASMCHPIDDQGTAIGILPEGIQEKLRENLERQKTELRNLMPRLEQEQLQTLFTRLQQRTMTPEQIKDLYALLIQQQQEAQNRHAPEWQQEDERQKPRIHQYLQQSQEQLKKFLQLPKSLSFLQNAEGQQESMPETSGSSPPQKSQSSPSPSQSPSSSASSFIVHHHPICSDSDASSCSKSQEKPKSPPCMTTLSVEPLKQEESQKDNEIELKATTTDEELRSKSPHSILEKLLQEHVQAVKKSEQEAVKGRKSTETKNKRQKKSKDACISRKQSKKFGLSKEEIHQRRKTLAFPNDLLNETLVSCSTSRVASEAPKSVNSFVDKTEPETNEEFIDNQRGRPRNPGLVDVPCLSPVKTEEESIAAKTLDVAPSLLDRESLTGLTSQVVTPESAQGDAPEAPACWNLSTTRLEGPRIGTNDIDSTTVLNGEPTSLDKNLADDMTVTLVQENTDTASPTGSFVKPSLITTKGGETTDCGEKTEGDVTEKDFRDRPESCRQVNDETSEASTVEEENIPSAITEGLDKMSVVNGSEKMGASSEPTACFSMDRISGGSDLVEDIAEKTDEIIPHENSNSSEVQPSTESQQHAGFISETKRLANSFSVFSSNCSDHNGDHLFGNKGLKTYSKKFSPIKRKSSTKDGKLEDNSLFSKVFKMDSGKSSKMALKKLVKSKRKAEMSQNVPNELSNSQAKKKSFGKQREIQGLLSEKTKKSRKKPCSKVKLPSKKAKCEEDEEKEEGTNRGISDSVDENAVKNEALVDDVDRGLNSVSFVTDQSVADMAASHRPTGKGAPITQFEDTKGNNEKMDISNERIREKSPKKKILKSKEQDIINDKHVGANSTAVSKDELANGENLESLVDSVMDEEIPVIYNGENVEKKVEPVKKSEKQRKRREKGKAERKRRARKHTESDGEAVSPTSEQYFLQDQVCANFSHLPKCRDCRDLQEEKSGFEFCRFSLFRRLRKKKNGTISAAGFQLPDHAAVEDLRPWLEGDKDMMDKNTSLYVLLNIGEQFCSVMQEEKKAITQAGEKMSVAYKRAVQGVREMCDVCATTIFNMHWVCHRCGFGVCLDCYNLRVKERQEQSGQVGKRVFEFKWLTCCPGVCHQPKSLSATQIIPKTILSDLGDELHRVRELWNIGRTCSCKGFVSSKPSNGAEITELSNEAMDTTENNQYQRNANDSCVGESEKREANEATPKPGFVSGSINQTPIGSDSSFDGSDDVNLICDEITAVESTANREQEWLTEEKRRNHFTKKAGFGLVDAKPCNNRNESAGLSLLMDYNSSADASPCDSPAKPKVGTFNFSFASGLDLLALAADWNRGTEEAITPESQPVATASEPTCAESCDELRQSTAGVPDHSDVNSNTDAPHSWLCDGRLLRLHDPRSPGNMKAFEQRWKKGEPVLVSHVDKYLNLDIWTPKSFGEEFGSEIADVVNCRNGVVIERFKVGDFWEGFESIKDRPLDNNGEPMLLKLKDWPPKDDFSEKLPTRFEDLMNNVPLPEYTRRDGSRNLVSRLPDFFVKPDLGPKMYNAYGSAACPKEGTTNLHLDMSDAVNVMVYVGVPRDQGAGEKERDDAIKAVDEACDESQRVRVRQETTRIGALWHIYAAEDADKIRDCLREITKERKMKHSQHHDPIHDQCFYLDHDIRQRLKKDYGVEGWAICQCLGDSVFIPAGAPHQVRNLYSCVKVAEDFVSPERIDHCFRMTQEFRHLSDKHTNHEDKLQVKNIIYHAVKDALTSLRHYEQEEALTTKGQME